jgi:hypothetical protein
MSVRRALGTFAGGRLADDRSASSGSRPEPRSLSVEREIGKLGAATADERVIEAGTGDRLYRWNRELPDLLIEMVHYLYRAGLGEDRHHRCLHSQEQKVDVRPLYPKAINVHESVTEPLTRCSVSPAVGWTRTQTEREGD